MEKGARDIVVVSDARPGALLETAIWFHDRFGGDATPAEFYANTGIMLRMAEGLSITVTEKIGDITSRSGGSKAIIFEGETKTTVETPTAFLLEIPIFRGGDLVQIPARLRVYARASGDSKRLEWTVEMYGIDRAVRKDVADMGETVKARTGLPVFVGAPE